MDSDPWSATHADVLEALGACIAEGRTAALAAVVSVEGSAYRRPGAKLVVPGEGEPLGAITAGCLEGPVADLGRTALAEGPRVETYDLTDDSEDAWGMGLGCNGIIDVYVEPLDESLDAALGAVREKRPVAVLTAIESDDPGVGVGDRTVLETDGAELDASPRTPLPDDVVAGLRDEAEGAATEGRGLTRTVSRDGGDVRVFVDGLEPVPDLLLFGSQPDVNAVADVGRRAGFNVRVASNRGARADEADFPAANEVLSARAPDLADVVDAPAYTYAVLMSHNFLDDRLALDSVLDADVPYVGLMGPRERFERMRDELEDEGTPLSREAESRVATPVGLDLGGGSPAEIALSIVSEAVAVRHGRDGGRLTDREGPIHERDAPAAPDQD